MNNAYKTFIALTLATATCFRTKAQNVGNQWTDNFEETLKPANSGAESEVFNLSEHLPSAQEQTDPSFLKPDKVQGITSALVEHPQFEEDSIVDGIAVVNKDAPVIAPEIMVEGTVIPWEITTEGHEIIQTWLRLQHDNGVYNELTPEDVYNSILKINMQSAEMAAQKIIAAQNSVQGFVKAENQTAYHQYPNPRVANPRGKGQVSTRKKAPTRRVVQQQTLRTRSGRT